MENEVADEHFSAEVASSQPGVKLVKLFSGRKPPACLKTVIQFYFTETEGKSQHGELQFTEKTGLGTFVRVC